MHLNKIIITLIFFFSASGICMADSVVISFEDGKTQSIELEAPVKSITKVEYLTKTQAATRPLDQQVNTVGLPPETSKQLPQQPSNSKPFKLKWAAPISGQ